MKKSNSTLAIALSAALLSGLLGGCNDDNPSALIAASKDFIAKNDNKSAVIQLKNALQKDPNLGEARFLLGKALLDSGDVTGAEVELRKAFELRYASEQTVPLLARALLASGQAKKVSDEFAATELPAGEARASLKTSLSVAYSIQGNNDAAAAALAAALAAQPDYAPAKLLEARKKAAAGNLAEAQTIVDGVLAREAKNEDALLLKGALLAAQGKDEESRAIYRLAIETRPDFLPAYSALIASLFAQQKFDEAATTLEALKKVAPRHPQTIYLDAQASYQRKDFKATRELTQQLLRNSPNNANALQLAGAAELQLGAYAQAETYLARALQAAPQLTLARRLLVSAQLRAGQPAKAIAALQPVLADIDKDAALLALAGEAYLQSGDANKAAEYLGKASKLEPDNAARKTALALAHLAQGNSSGAFAELEQISSADKGTTADLALIAAYLRSNQLDKALRAIDTLDRKQPDNPATFNLRGRTQLAQKNVPGARQSFARALALNRLLPGSGQPGGDRPRGEEAGRRPQALRVGARRRPEKQPGPAGARRAARGQRRHA